MRVLRLAALIGLAQIGVVVILFSFAYSIAHAATNDWQPLEFAQDSKVPTALTWGSPAKVAALYSPAGGSYDSSGLSMYPLTNFSSNGTLQDGQLNTFKFSAPSGAWTTSTVTGTWHVIFRNNTVGDWGSIYNHSYAAALTDDAYVASFDIIVHPAGWVPNTDFSTRIVPSAPVAFGQVSTTTGSTSVTFTTQYYYNTTAIGDPLTALNLRLYGLNQASSTTYTLTPLVGDSLETKSYTLTLPTGSQWNYAWDFDATAPWGSISEFGTPTQQVFVVTNPIAAGLATTTNNIGGTYTPASCSITDLTGCFQNAIAFLFWPDPIAFQQFSTVSGNVRNHAPFGYVYIMLGQVGQISGSTTPTFSLAIDSTIQTAYFDPIKNGLATVLWALAAMWFLNRLRKLDL